MHYTGLSTFLTSGKAALATGPIALVLVEDDVEVASTLRHHQRLGFGAVLAFMPAAFDLPEDLQDSVHRIDFDATEDGAMETAVNAVIAAAPKVWMHYCFNAEYLFFPFCETRSIGEVLAFHTEERRDAMLTYVIDIYAEDLGTHPDGVCLDRACLDRSGYYGLARKDALDGNAEKDRQMDFYGGLRWRFEEHVPWTRRKIDRIGLFRAKPGLTLRADHTFSDEEYNTFACPWHHNLTAAICSFRTAKALKTNPGSKFEITTFKWQNSERFEWNSRQLLDLGLIEPGQWF